MQLYKHDHATFLHFETLQVSGVILFSDDRGWAHFTNSSGDESKYNVLNGATTYTSAQQQCWRLGGHLAHVTSIEEQFFLEHLLQV